MLPSEHIDYSIELIRKGERLALALNPEGYFVGFSGGKDSQVLLELVKMAGVKYHAYYSVTTNDPPQNIYFIRQHYPEVTFLHPKENFFKLVEKKGLPTIRYRFCCSVLKEQAGAGYAVLTGVRADESRKRAAYNDVKIISRRKEHADRTKQYTIEEIEEHEHRCIKGKDKLMIYPILHWLEDEVWEFIYRKGLPVNPCYQQSGRVGCMFCPFSNKRQLEHYENEYPKFKERLIASYSKFLRGHNWIGREFGTAEDYYNWWKSRECIETYKAKQRQLSLF